MMRETPSAGRLSDHVHAVLRQMILTMELLPGEVITEVNLSQRLRCGRTPLREALHRLAQEGLVVVRPRRGVAVAELSIIDLGNLLETLSEVEAFAARYAAVRISAGELTMLEDILSKLQDAVASGDLTKVVEIDFEFHCGLAQAARNPYTEACLMQPLRLAIRFALLGLRRAGSGEGTVHDDSRILAALAQHDPEEAERYVREHLRNAKNRMLAAI